MTIDQMIEVMQAYKDGKRIEMRHKNAHSTYKWTDTTVPPPTWDFPTYDYRIKPEPREFLVLVDKHGQVLGSTTTFKAGQVVIHAQGSRSVGEVTVVKVREVV